jgi:hypothetical protein
MKVVVLLLEELARSRRRATKEAVIFPLPGRRRS